MGGEGCSSFHGYSLIIRIPLLVIDISYKNVYNLFNRILSGNSPLPSRNPANNAWAKRLKNEKIPVSTDYPGSSSRGGGSPRRAVSESAPKSVVYHGRHGF
jgi:hypothetical protein